MSSIVRPSIPIEGKVTTIKELYRFIRLRTEYGEQLALDPIELDTITLDKYNTPAKIEREALTREEVRRLFDAMDSYRNRLLAIVAAETGLRNSDLRNLRLEDVDFDEPSLYVGDPKMISHTQSQSATTSCSNSKSGVISTDRPMVAHSTASFLFPGNTSSKIETNEGLNQIVKTAAEDAGIQGTLAVSELTPAQQEALHTGQEQREWHRVTVHTLRHTCLTLMKEAGVSLQYRQLVANHQDPLTTQRYSQGKEEEFAVIRNQYDPPR